jgi:hypothetical protein
MSMSFMTKFKMSAKEISRDNFSHFKITKIYLLFDTCSSAYDIIIVCIRTNSPPKQGTGYNQMQGSYVKYTHSGTRFEFFKSVNTNIPVFCDVTPCSMDDEYECFGRKSCLHSQGGMVEYRGITFLRNVGTYPPRYISSHSKDHIYIIRYTVT